MGFDVQNHYFFDALLKNPKLEIEWVDLMSQLEFVGCRKIIKNISFSEITVQSLKHLSEEANHAFLLKTAAEQSGLNKRTWAEGLFSFSGWEYFHELDKEISEMQPEKRRYPAVSWVIETRVLTFYPWYMERCAFPKVKRVLGQILAQEQRHAEFFGTVPFSDTEKGEMLRAEQQLWQKFIEKAHQIIQKL